MIELHQSTEQTFKLLERDHVGTVRRRLVRVLMGFDEDTGDADRDSGARQHGHEFPLATG